MFEDFFLSLTELLTFCEVKCLNADSVDVDYCQDKLNNAVQALQCIEQNLLDLDLQLLQLC